MKRPTPRLLTSVALCAPFTILLILHARHYLPFLSDDALISLRYAKRLIHGQGLSWTDGPPVEGYSNLLWILVVALPAAFGANLINSARVLGVLGMTTAIFVIAYRYGWQQTRQSISWFPASIALLFFALAGPVAVWAIGGLEQPLYAALLAISIGAMFAVVESPRRKSLWPLSFTLGLLCLTRPDGPLFVVLAAGAFFATRRESHRPLSDAARLLLLPGVFAAAQLIFRLVYYGTLVPNTALVKISPSLVHWLDGWRYLSAGLRSLQPWPVLAAMAAAWCLWNGGRSRARLAYPLLIAAGWSAYVVFIGGDIFPAYRHLVPLIVAMAFVLAEGASLVDQRFAGRPRMRLLLVALAIVLFAPYARTQLLDKQNRRAIQERWEWQGREVAALLKTAFARQRPLIAVTAAGAIPYWSDLPSLDMLGLNDYYIPRHPPPDFGSGVLGHELGDADYVLGRQPDIIIFTVGSEPGFRIGEELQKRAEFREGYVPVTTAHAGYLALMFFRKDSTRVGIARSARSAAIPGFLFTAPETVAVLNGRNELVARVPAHAAARLSLRWQQAEAVVIDVDASQTSAFDTITERNGEVMTITIRSRSDEAVDVRAVMLRSAL